MNQRAGPRFSLLVTGVAALAFMLAAAGALDRPTAIWPGATALSLAAPIFQVLAILVGVPYALMVIWVALFTPRRADDGSGWRRQLALYKTNPALRSKRVQADKLASVLSGMDTEALAIAAILPDHSEQGRAAALAELRARNAPDLPPKSPQIPSFLTGLDLGRLEQTIYGARERSRNILLYIALAAFVIGLTCYGWNDLTADKLEPSLGGTETGQAFLYWARGNFDGQTMFAIPKAFAHFPGAFAIFVRMLTWYAAGLVFALAWLGGKLIDFVRARPARILLLRKFNDQRLGRLYRRLIKEELQPGGQVVALADKYVQRSVSRWITDQLFMGLSSFAGAIYVICTLPVSLVLRAFDRTRWGPAYIANARDFRLLGARLWDRIEINMEASLAVRGYLIRTTDAWWQNCIGMLLQSADVIVLDLSEVTGGTEWEIQRISELALWGRVVCIAHEDAAENANLRLAQSGAFHAAGAPSLFLYSSSGAFKDRAAFRGRFLDSIACSLTEKQRDLH